MIMASIASFDGLAFPVVALLLHCISEQGAELRTTHACSLTTEGKAVALGV